MEQPEIPCMPAHEHERDVYRELLAFLLDDREDVLRLGLATRCSQYARRQIHSMAGAFGFKHMGAGEGAARHVVIWKRGPPPHGPEPRSTPAPARLVPPPVPRRPSERLSGAPAAVVAEAPAAVATAATAAAAPEPVQPTRDDLKAMMEAFAADSTRTVLNCPTWYSRDTRVLIHELATAMHLDHDSFGERGLDRYVRLTKVDPETLRQRLAKQNGLNVAYARYREKMDAARARAAVGLANDRTNVPLPPVQACPRGALRMAQFNIEWMSDWFAPEGTAFVAANPAKEIADVDALCRKVAQVIRASLPDVLSVEEGPATKEQMELFVTRYLDGQYLVYGGLENLQQQLYLLVRRDGPVESSALFAPALDYLSQPWFFDGIGEGGGVGGERETGCSHHSSQWMVTAHFSSTSLPAARW